MVQPDQSEAEPPTRAAEIAQLRADRDAAMQASQAAMRDTTRLTRLLTILSEPAPVEHLLDRVLLTLSELFLADIVVLLDVAEPGRFAPLAAIGLPEAPFGQPMLDIGCDYVASVVRTRTPMLTEAAHRDPRVAPQLRELGAEMIVWLPVIGSQRVQAALVLARCRPDPFAHTDVDVLTAMAYRIGLTLEYAQYTLQLARAEQALRASEERFRALIRNVSDVITILAADGTICYTSPAVETVWGCASETLIGSHILALVHPDDHARVQELLATLLAYPGEPLTQSLRLYKGQGVWRDFEVNLRNLLGEPAVSGIVATFHDITERKVYERELTRMAFHDPLTGLANRAAFREQLRQALMRADARGGSVAVMFFDLDNFKLVNDTLGHALGDEVLRIVADRVQSCLRHDDIAARIGGDEFTILIERVIAVEQVLQLADRLMAALRDPLRLQGHNLPVGASLGIAISTPGQDSPEMMLHKADKAMYYAKSTGKGQYTIFDSHVHRET